MEWDHLHCPGKEHLGESDHMTHSAKLRTNVGKLLINNDKTRRQLNRDCHHILTCFLLWCDSVRTQDSILRSNCSYFLNMHHLY